MLSKVYVQYFLQVPSSWSGCALYLVVFDSLNQGIFVSKDGEALAGLEWFTSLIRGKLSILFTLILSIVST